MKTGSSQYTLPEVLGIEQWALEGEWTFTDLTTSLVSGTGRFQMYVNEPDIYISFSVKDYKQTKVAVYLDGKYVPKENAGEDLRVSSGEKAESYFYIEAEKHYQLYKNLEGPHTIEIRLDYPGTTLHSVSFPRRFED